MWLKTSKPSGSASSYTYLDLRSVTRFQTQWATSTPQPDSFKVVAFYANETQEATVADGFSSMEDAAAWIEDALKNVKEA